MIWSTERKRLLLNVGEKHFEPVTNLTCALVSEASEMWSGEQVNEALFSSDYTLIQNPLHPCVPRPKSF